MTSSENTSFSAFESKALALTLTQNRDLMDRYKKAAEQGQIEAVRSGNQNLTVVRDDEIVHLIREADASLRTFRVDTESGKVSPA